MINIEELKPQIIKALMPLKPDKIILFGSYAYGEPFEYGVTILDLIFNERHNATKFMKSF